MYKNILFVCTGNSCRSPMAEGILDSLMAGKNYNISSAGTFAINDIPPAQNGINISKSLGVDISEIRSRQLNEKIIKAADLVLVMSIEHLDFIKDHFAKYFDKSYLLLKFGRESDKPQKINVEDPIGGDERAYLECYNLLQTELKRIIPLLESEEKS